VILSGKFEREERSLLEARIMRDGEPIYHAIAFNDVVVNRSGFSGMVELRASVDGRYMYNQRSDGLIVATPTGSTAYSFSAGGPIVSPAVEALLVTPASPHSAYNRGLVLSVRDTLTLEVLSPSGPVAVEVDGQATGQGAPGDQIELRPRPAAAHVVRLGMTTFYERARRKLRLTDSAEVLPALDA
jgi:NAD+ kinase